GTDVAARLGITKWEPPLESTDGEAERPHPAFHGYTDIENYRNFPDLFEPGEEWSSPRRSTARTPGWGSSARPRPRAAGPSWPAATTSGARSSTRRAGGRSSGRC